MSRLDKFVARHELSTMKICFYKTIKHITKPFKISLLSGRHFYKKQFKK